MSMRIVVPLMAFAVLLSLPRIPASAQDTPNCSIENNCIRLVVNKGPDEAGRFSIRTTGGDMTRPATKNQHLIFGGDVPWTSYTSLLIDGEKYVFGGPTHRRAGQDGIYGTAISEPMVNDDKSKITCVYKYGDIEVAQELGVVQSLSSRQPDTIGITYRVTNRGTINHEVGVRVMLDTMCGANDAAPARVGVRAIATATEVAGKEIPDYWMAFDNLMDPVVISQGTLRGGKTTEPDSLIIADWGTLADEVWQPTLIAGQGFIRKGEDEPDSAAALLWKPVTLEPGQSKVFTTYYGMGDLTPHAGELSLALTAPAETTFEHERTQSITITGYVQNTRQDKDDARNVSLTLELPTGLKLAEDSPCPLIQHFDTLKPGEIKQASWLAKPDGNGSGTLPLKLSVTVGNDPGTNDTKREIQVNVPKPQLKLAPSTQSVPLFTNKKPSIILVQVNLTPAEGLYGAGFTMKFDPNLVRPLGVTRGRTFVEDEALLQGWNVDDSEVDNGRITVSGLRVGTNPITQAEANIATVKFMAVAEGTCPLTLEATALINQKGERTPLGTAQGNIVVVAMPAK